MMCTACGDTTTCTHHVPAHDHVHVVSILKWLLPYDSHPRLREEGAELVLVLLNAYANANVRSPSASLQPPHDVLSFYARLLTPLDERARAVAEKEMLPVVAAEQVVAEGGTPAVVAASSTPVTTASASTSSAINDDNINSHVLLPLVTTDLAAVEDANIVLLQMFITNIVDLATVDADALVTSASPSAVLADPATVSAATQGAPLAQLTSNATIYMLRLLMDHHLVELFPSLPTSAARHGDASIIDRRPRMLALLLDFIKRHVLHASRSPIAARVLNPAVLGGHMPLWRVLVDELVKEALLQPPAEMELVRAALQVFQLWTLVPQAEPLLLMPATALADSSVGTNNNGSTGVVPAAVMTAADIFALKPHMLLERLNQHVRRCLESAFLVFVAPHNTMDVSEGQVALFRDVLTMVRSVAMESALVLDGDTW